MGLSLCVWGQGWVGVSIVGCGVLSARTSSLSWSVWDVSARASSLSELGLVSGVVPMCFHLEAERVM